MIKTSRLAVPNKSATGRASRPAAATQGELLVLLFTASYGLNASVREAGKRLGTVTESGGASIALIGDLLERGPMSVATTAKLRAQSRQHVQKLADQLAGEGLIEFIDNPAHKRSPLMRVTALGKTSFESMRSRSVRAGDRLTINVEPAAMLAAIEVVKRVTVAMDTALARPLPPRV